MDPFSVNLNSLYTKTNDKELNLDIFNYIDINEENDLKYKKYTYIIDTNTKMSTENNDNGSNTQQDPNLNINIDKINKLASAGIEIFDTFLNTSDKLVKTFSDKVKEFNKDTPVENNNPTVYKTNIHDNGKIVNEIKFYKHEDNANIYYALELPRIRKEDCSINFLDNRLCVKANTHTAESGFEFLPDELYEITLVACNNITKDSVIAKHVNGMLYITIKKKIDLSNNFNINILD